MVWELLFYAGIGSLAGFFCRSFGNNWRRLDYCAAADYFADGKIFRCLCGANVGGHFAGRHCGDGGAEFSHPRQRRAGVLADCRLDADRRLCRRAACGDCSSAHSRKNCARFFNFVYVTPQLAFVF